MEYSYEKIYLTLSHAGHETSCETGPWGPGVRDLYIIHYIVSGSGFFETEGRKYYLSKGQSFLIVPNKPIFYYPDPNDPWEYVWFNFYGAQATNILSRCSMSAKNPVAAPSEGFPIDIALELVDNHGDLSSGAICKNEALLHLILAWYVAGYPSAEKQVENKLINIAVKVLEDKFHKKNFNVDEWSNLLHISRATLYRQFERSFNITPKKYLAQRRVEKACELLKTTDLPIKTVAFSVGFDDQLSFSKFFKSNIGNSPKDYRETHKK